MASILAAVGAVKAWQVIGAGAAIAVIGAGSWAGYRTWGPDRTLGVAASEQIVPVQRGDLVSNVSVNGTLSFPTRETLAFSAAGTVASVSATAGQLVKAGQELARLDPATIANLEAAVAQARVNARNAADNLAAAQTLDPVKLAQARLDVQNAQDALEALLHPSELTLAQAESAVANARLVLQNAEEARQRFLDDNSASELQGALQAAATSLQNATDSLAVTKAGWDSRLPPLRTTRDTTLAAYRAVLEKYVGLDISSDPAPRDPESLLASRGIVLSAAYSSVPATGVSYGIDVPSDDPATPWNETTIFLWKSFYPGMVIASCDTAPVQQGAVCVSNELDKAWTQYQVARDNLGAQENQAAVALAASQASVDKAKQARDVAQAAASAGGPDQVAVAAQDRDVAVARARMNDADKTLASLKTADAKVVALKQAQLDATRTKLQDMEQGDPLSVGLLQSNLAAANAALDTAQARLAGAVLKSPWNGDVSAVNITVGQSVAQNLGAIEIVDPTTVQLNGTLDEIDVLYVQPGARAQVTLDALAGQAIQGTVATISSQGASQQGVVTFPVTVDVTAPQGVQLREGLSATATIVLNQELNVLLIPARAVSGTFAQPVVHVLKGGSVQQQPVTLGNSDGFWVAVTEGLSEGDRVVMAGSRTTSAQLNAQTVIRGVGGFGLTGPGGAGFDRQQFRDAQGQGAGQRTNGQGASGQGAQRTGGQTNRGGTAGGR